MSDKPAKSPAAGTSLISSFGHLLLDVLAFNYTDMELDCEDDNIPLVLRRRSRVDAMKDAKAADTSAPTFNKPVEEKARSSTSALLQLQVIIVFIKE